MTTNNETSHYVHAHVIPSALDLLPSRMATREAHAMLLAIGLQESRFAVRTQSDSGPAHGFWQFERGGINAVLRSPDLAVILTPALHVLRYSGDPKECYEAVESNDVLACVFARLLLWSLPGALPLQSEEARAWTQYTAAWRPGRPHSESWAECFTEAWRMVAEE